jgi:hypothetical protein
VFIAVELQYWWSLDAMDGRQHWQQQNQYQYNQTYNQNYQQSESQYSQAASDSVQDAQGLLAVYPMASANPTNHGSYSKLSLSFKPQ